MEHYVDSFEDSVSLPTVKDIEQRLRTLGCTKEQISRHLDQVAKSRIQSTEQKLTKHRDHQLDWPQSDEADGFPSTTA